MEISLPNASVLSHELENVKVFSLFQDADVLLIEAADKRKTDSHTELLLTTLIVHVFCLLFFYGLKAWTNLRD